MKDNVKGRESSRPKDGMRIVDGPEGTPEASLEQLEDLLKLDPDQVAERAETEAYWAGRNHAMRRSGRIAA